MPKQLNNEATEKLTRRINQLKAASQPKWGKMTVTQMMAHCSTALQMAFGDIPVKVTFSPLAAAFARFAFITLLPFPKGKTPTAPELDAAKGLKYTDDFEAEKSKLIDQLRRMNNAPANHEFAMHPIFRKMSRKSWGQLIYKHLNHHLEQFGV